MLHSKTLKQRICKIYEDHQCIFENLLERGNSHTTHERNIQKLGIDMFKVNSRLSVKLVKNFIMWKIITILNINQRKLKVDHVNTEKYGNRSVSHFGPKIRNCVLQETKNVTSLAAFKTKTGRWIPICSCRIFRIYIHRAGFI